MAALEQPGREPALLSVQQEFLCVGVNRVVNTLSWSEGGYVAYGAHHLVAVYDPQAAEVVMALPGHSSQVNCVAWVPPSLLRQDLLPAGTQLLVSGAADGELRLWAVRTAADAGGPVAVEDAAPPPWQILACLKGHTGPISSVAMHALPRADATGDAGHDTGAFVLVSTAGDSALRVWECRPTDAAGASNGAAHAQGSAPVAPPAALQLQQQREAVGVVAGAGGGAAARWYGPHSWSPAPPIPVGTQMQHAVALTHLPGLPGWLLLVTGGTDCRLHLHCRPPGAGATFQAALKVPGHEGWIRSVALQHVRGGSAAAAAAATAASHAGPSELLIATASQDRYGRIWKLALSPAPHPAGANGAQGQQQGDAAQAEQDQADPLEAIMLYSPKPSFTAGGHTYHVTLESLLIGHEDWVHSACWQPLPASSPAPGQAEAAGAGGGSGGGLPGRSALALLTASMDRTMMLWTCDPGSGLWMSVASVGDAGAMCLGYFGGVFSSDARFIMAHGFTGAIHLWERQDPQALAPKPQQTAEEAEGRDGGGAAAPGPPGGRHALARAAWVPRHALGGHWDQVVGVAWGGDGDCVLSVSADQTARVFTAVPLPHASSSSAGSSARSALLPSGGAGRGEPGGGGAARAHWCEVARPQVHGHDFSCAAVLPRGTAAATYAYVSGSEEKVLRVMEGTQSFCDSLRLLKGRAAGGAGAPAGAGDGATAGGGGAVRARAFGASVSALGLTNKAVMGEGDAQQAGLAAPPGAAGVGADGMPGAFPGFEQGSDFVPNAAPSVVGEPPLEEHLAQNTLWPEAYKLYGHGDMLYCCAASPDGAYVASACVAKSEAQAAVWVWDVAGGTWKGVAQLQAHSLTVTQLAWSRSGRLLASCSRDRSFSVFVRGGRVERPGDRARDQQPPQQQQQQQQHAFQLAHRAKAAHARIIWGVAWSHDDALLATGARDNLVKLWRVAHDPASGEKDSVSVSPRPALTLPAFAAAVTAVAWAPRPWRRDGGYLLAVGLESGELQLWTVLGPAGGGGEGEGAQQWSAALAWRSGAVASCAAQVASLAWQERQEAGEAAAGLMRLAAGAHDHSVRVLVVR